MNSNCIRFDLISSNYLVHSSDVTGNEWPHLHNNCPLAELTSFRIANSQLASV